MDVASIVIGLACFAALLATIEFLGWV